MSPITILLILTTIFTIDFVHSTLDELKGKLADLEAKREQQGKERSEKFAICWQLIIQQLKTTLFVLDELVESNNLAHTAMNNAQIGNEAKKKAQSLYLKSDKQIKKMDTLIEQTESLISEVKGQIESIESGAGGSGNR